MTELEKVQTIAKDSVEKLASRQSEPSWLLDKRLAAWESYYKTPMPSPADEGWKRLDIDAFDLSCLVTANIPAATRQNDFSSSPEWLSVALAGFKDLSGVVYQNVQKPGFYTLKPSLSSRGVICCDMNTAIREHADKIKPYLDCESKEEEENKFSWLTRALSNCGMFLYVPRGVEIEEPFVYAVDLSNSGGQAVLPRTLVVAGELSRMTVAYILGPTQAGAAEAGPAISVNSELSCTLVSQLVEMHVKPGASLTYLEVQLQDELVVLLNRSNCMVGRDGRYESLTLALGRGQTKSDMATVLSAPGAESEILGLLLGAGQEKFSFNTIQEHAAPDTKSDINFRTALKDKSSSVYQGIVRVAKIAQRTNAYQSNKNLLLDGGATADSIPKLEILADDVKCSHGATVGPVDREQIFYLMSRGVTRSIAEQLVVLGFFRQTLEMFSCSQVIAWLRDCVTRKMLGGGCDDSTRDFFIEEDQLAGETT